MQKVAVKRDDVLGVLRTNKEDHSRIYNEALEQYKKTVCEVLTKALAAAQRKDDVDFAEIVGLSKPFNHLKEYDRAIKMLEMSTDERVELTQQEFSQLVMDDWGWQRQFLVSNSRYSSSAMAKTASMGYND